MHSKLPSRLLVSVALAAISGCAPSHKVHVRAAMPPVVSSPSLEQGIALLRSGNVSMAIETLQIAARREPNPRRAFNALGVAYDRLGRFDLSRSYYERALALAPADADILHNLSLSLRMQGRVAEAEEVAQEEQSRRFAATQEHADATPAPSVIPPAASAVTPSSASAETVLSQMAKVKMGSVPLAPVPQAVPSFAVRGASIEVALPPPVKASAGIAPAVQSVAPRPRSAIAVSSNAVALPPAGKASAGIIPLAHSAALQPRATTALSSNAVALPPAGKASAGIAPAVQSAAPQPRATIAVSANAVALSPAVKASAGTTPAARSAAPQPRATIAVSANGPALPVPMKAGAGIALPANSASPRPRTIIAVSANVRRAPLLGLRVVNCVGRRGMARRIAGAIAARGFAGAQLADATRQYDRTVLILPNATPARFAEVLRSLNIRPAVVRYRNVKFATLMLGADAIALDQQLVRTRRT